MNKMLVSIFDNEAAADAGLRALHKLHADGDITLYATGVLVKDADGKVTVKKSMDSGPVGTGVGLAVGGLIGLLGGPVLMAVGAMTGAVAGAVRDLWVAGVGLDFVEETGRLLKPGVRCGFVVEDRYQHLVHVNSSSGFVRAIHRTCA